MAISNPGYDQSSRAVEQSNVCALLLRRCHHSLVPDWSLTWAVDLGQNVRYRECHGLNGNDTTFLLIWRHDADW